MTDKILQTVSATDVHTWMLEGKIDLYDIREQDEYDYEHIEGSVLHPLSVFDATQIKGDKICVFHCGSATRTANEAAKLLSVGYDDIYHMEEGMIGWKKANLPIVKAEKQVLPIMRQVQITVGIAIIIFIMLGHWVSPSFNILAGIVGAGLCFAGITGICGMAKFLSYMPWNRQNDQKASRCCSK